MIAVGAFIFGAEVNPLDGPEDVTCGEDYNGGREHGEQITELPNGEDDKYFADETTEAGQAQTGEEDDHRHRGVKRHFSENTTEFVEVAVMDAVIKDADDKEHAGGADAVGDH